MIHAHMFGSNLWGTVIGRLTHVPIVIAHEHTWSFEGEPLKRLLDRELIARWSDAFVAVSRADRRRMIEIERIPPERIRFIPNGITPERQPPAAICGPSSGSVRGHWSALWVRCEPRRLMTSSSKRPRACGRAIRTYTC